MSMTKDSSWPEWTKPRAGLQPSEVTTAWAIPYMHWAAAVTAWFQPVHLPCDGEAASGIGPLPGLRLGEGGGAAEGPA
ncbi:hypothetical protein SCWH03_18190 [Streptomyces pacificus]|uniref:Uncharacterized protein n=1 Tax=Streptomyces pacificus TaxID=2705029 RepID=A0A6A0ASB7_9ACTN|nr:hypothetical protein SCWH03_18190 [Streptomyces pacificus]